jgi:hypothetical protein
MNTIEQKGTGMKRLHAAALTLTLAAGFAVAIALTVPAVALAWNWHQMPLGYSISVAHYVDLNNNACDQVTIDGQYMGDDCTDPAGLDANVDAYLNSTICTKNLAVGIANGFCVTTTTAPSTTTDSTTAATTTTDQTTTGAASPGASTTTTTADTVTVTVTTTDATIETRVAALEKQYTALAARVGAIAQANTASWDAFSQTLAAGGTVAEAAIAARSAGLNAIYQLA